MNDPKTKTIKVDYLARVEGEGAMRLDFRDGELKDVKLKIFEPPRFFEGFLRGRDYSEASDITARICGICPVAYQMCAVHAMEQVFGMKVDGVLRDLRRLLYCGEWISSHTLHVAMLHAPDFLGYESSIHMAADHQDKVELALELKKAGNTIMNVLGGREIHPINVCVGGFYKTPTRRELHSLLPIVQRARVLAGELLGWVSGFDFPKFEQDYTFVALRHPEEYPFNEGRVASSSGLDIDVRDWDLYFEEEHVAWSNALHCSLRGVGAYHVGPMARYALNYDRLPATVQQLAENAGLEPVCRNPFKSILVRAVEIIYACEEAERIITAYEEPDEPAVAVEVKAGVGYSCTEAPRGILYHRYEVSEEGEILHANIIPPTSQNQKMIEEDLWRFIPDLMHLPEEELKWRAEQSIRNYDPCISCATHFLKLEINHE